MPREIARIDLVAVTQDESGRVHWISGAAIDADGANGQNGNPFAYRADNRGLDDYSNAGWPDRGWRNVLIDSGDGQPHGDDDGNWYSRTTYAWKDRPMATRYVDASSIPYMVVNPIVRLKAVGVAIGCRGRITHRGRSVEVVVADVSGASSIGEMSIAAARRLGIPSSPRNGGVARGVTFEMWPGCAAVVDGETYELQRA